MSAPAVLISPLVSLAAVFDDLDPTPEPEDVKAGYPALFIFLGLLLVVGLLGWSLFRHLRQTDANRRAGMFGDPPEVPESPEVRDATTEPGDGPGSPDRSTDASSYDDRSGRPPGGSPQG